ncbi:MAG: dihydrolipoyl dehydrogenase [Planctomycetes bacterium]|nr:dihydrolipoyl dehydrogenase [Planctomycetota bacterium]
MGSKMKNSYDFDIVVIGGGPAGYVAAIRASQLGANVALIEKHFLGGVCGNVGCIPTKALIHTARVMLEVERAVELGLEVNDLKLDFARAAEHRDGVVETLRQGVQQLVQSKGVELLRGDASFSDSHTLAISGSDEETEITAAKIMVATGSQPVELPQAPFEGEKIIDSSTAVHLDELPDSLLVVGGGYIGCEFSAAFTTLGVDVTIVEMLDRILSLMDPDCAREVYKFLKKRGADIYTGTKMEGIETTKSGIKATLSNGKTVEAEKALICVGRRPFAEGIGLQEIGVELDQKGAIKVNEHLQTSVPHIYAIGDVNGGTLLAHVASYEGTVAAAHATGTLSATVDYRVVPAIAFTHPEVGTVGLNEEDAEKQGLDVITKKFPMRALGKAHVDAELDGFTKIIADADTKEILGVHIVCSEASNLIAEGALAMQLEATADELAEMIHAHPSMPEALKETAEGIIGLPIHWSG